MIKINMWNKLAADPYLPVAPRREILNQQVKVSDILGTRKPLNNQKLLENTKK